MANTSKSLLHALVPTWQCSLLSRWYWAAGDPVGIGAAIAAGEEALGALEAGHVSRARLIDDLVHSLLGRGSAGDLERAEELADFAVAVPRAQWPALPAQLRSLAYALRTARCPRRATDVYRFAAGHPERGDLRSRFAAACDWARWAHSRNDGAETAEALDHARATARLVAQIWLAGGAEAAHRFRPLTRLAAATRDMLGGSSAAAGAQAVHELLAHASRGVPGPVPEGLAARHRAAAERLRHLDRSSLDFERPGPGMDALRGAWVEMDGIIAELPLDGLPAALFHVGRTR
jgi:hypothetical protein